MFKFRFIALVVFLQLAFATSVYARDFDWLQQLSIEAQADPSGFVARLSTRFHIGDAEVRAVINNVGNQADAYMVMRLAEMSHHPVAYVSEQYRDNKRRGWGVLAKRLGIKPGSRAFHALKAGHDLDTGMRDAGPGRGNGHGHGNGRGRGKGNHENRGHGHDED
jgi:hypothetical protein